MEKGRKVLEGTLQGDRRVCIDAQQESRMEITDCERKTIVPILQTELALVVSSPNIIRPLGDGLGAAGMGTAVAAPGLDQSVV